MIQETASALHDRSPHRFSATKLSPGPDSCISRVASVRRGRPRTDALRPKSIRFIQSRASVRCGRPRLDVLLSELRSNRSRRLDKTNALLSERVRPRPPPSNSGLQLNAAGQIDAEARTKQHILAATSEQQLYSPYIRS